MGDLRQQPPIEDVDQAQCLGRICGAQGFGTESGRAARRGEGALQDLEGDMNGMARWGVAIGETKRVAGLDPIWAARPPFRSIHACHTHFLGKTFSGVQTQTHVPTFGLMEGAYAACGGKGCPTLEMGIVALR